MYAILLVAVMLLGMLSGCGSSAGSGASTPAEPEEVQSVAEESAPSEVPEAPAEEPAEEPSVMEETEIEEPGWTYEPMPSNYGVEGETYDMVDGEPVFQEWTYSTVGSTFSSILMDYTFLAMVDANVETPGKSEAAKSCSATWNENIDNANDYPGAAAMTIDEGDQYNRHAGDLVTLVQQYTAKFITGDESLEAIPEFHQKLLDTGIEECIEAKQSAYDRYMARD